MINTPTLSFSKRRQIRKMWLDHCKLMQRLKSTSWQLLSHPDATAEQLERVRTASVALAKLDREVIALLRKQGFDV